MNPFDEELGETLTICHGAGVMQSVDKGVIWPLNCCGTLCARDGIKTVPRTPSGQDAWQKKLIVQATVNSSRQGGVL